MINKEHMTRLIKTALDEDLGTGDITTMSTVPDDKIISGRFISKADGILCGMNVVQAVFDYVDESITLDRLMRDGDIIKKGDIIAAISGPAMPILIGERLALNMLQRMSGIATRTAAFAAQVKDTPVRIIDTRKTTPGLRVFEKYAVRVGGGYNHRFSLSDGVLIKDNHIKSAGGVGNAVRAAKDFVPHTLRIEVEVETMDEVQEALDAGADIIMLDNMGNEIMAKAIQLIAGRALVEASGNMDQKDLAAVAKTGVDYISIGALTNALYPLDISLKFD